MTSGNFTSFPINSIVVIREERQRKELVDIEDLAESLKRIGLIHPIVIERDGKLVAGERRLTAAKLLGWDTISVQFAEDLTQEELKVIELEENIKRVGISWKDRCLAIKEYHDLRKNSDEAWTIAKTAQAIGISREAAQENVTVGIELSAGNKKVVEAPKFSVAKNIIARDNSRRKDSIADSILRDIPVEQAQEELEAIEGDTVKKPPLLLANFIDWQATYDGPKFNFIHCDFPYGVNADKHDQGSAKKFGGYSDTPEDYKALLEALHSAMDNVVANSAHLMFWFSMTTYQETYDALTRAGWIVDRFPLIWCASDNAGVAPDPQRGPRRIYETCLFARRGDRKVVQAVSNHFAHPRRDKTIHMSEKPVPMLTHFMRMIVDGHSAVLDPTCGSANAIKAASQLGAARVLGIEKEKEFYDAASDNYFE